MIRSGQFLQVFVRLGSRLTSQAIILICAPVLAQSGPPYNTEAVFSEPGRPPHVVDRMFSTSNTIKLTEPLELIKAADVKTRGYFLSYPSDVTAEEESEVRIWFDKNAKIFKLTATIEPNLNDLWKLSDNHSRALKFWMEATTCEQEGNNLIAKRFCEESLRLLEGEHDVYLRRHVVYFYVDQVLKKLGKTEQAQKIETDFNFHRDSLKEQRKRESDAANLRMIELNRPRPETQKSPIP